MVMITRGRDRTNPLPRNMRTPRIGPELEMIDAALKAGLLVTRGAEPIVFREPELPTGFPDVVAVYPKHNSDSAPAPRIGLTKNHLRFLHHFYVNPGTTAVQASNLLCWSERNVQSIVNDLIAARLLRSSRERLSVAPRSVAFRVRRIVAIEAKMKDWRNALDQATGNTWFASHSYVLLPERVCFDDIVREADARGVGVLAFNGSTVRTVREAKTHSIPASYGSWLFNEWLTASKRSEETT